MEFVDAQASGYNAWSQYGSVGIRNRMNVHTDFWNFSRYSCAWDFWERSTLLCIVAKAASTGVKSLDPVEVILEGQ